jgi:hypothetical protein
MRRLQLAVILTALAMASAANAQGRDCRWFGEVMGCKDGKGHWRRVGDDEILGTYSVAKPKPKLAPVVAPAPTAPAVSAPVAALPADPPPPPPPPIDSATVAEAPPPAPVPAIQPPPTVPEARPIVPPEEQPHRSWWRRWLDSIWHDIQTLLRLIGIGR